MRFHLDALPLLPESGECRDFADVRLAGVREWKVGKELRLFYRLRDGTPEVLRILDVERDLVPFTRGGRKPQPAQA
jgi:hypothetical protein